LICGPYQVRDPHFEKREAISPKYFLDVMTYKVLYILRFDIVKKDLVMAMPWHRQLFADFCLWQPGFDYGTVHMGFMVRQ
jgi:hypothetical protein